MFRYIFMLAVLVICTIRTAGFAIYTFKEKNKVGSASITFLIIALWAFSLIFIMK